MLKKMELSNFLSFRNNTVFNFEKSNYQFLENKNTINRVTKGSFFIGANASGKTNGIKGIRLLLDLLLGNREIDIDGLVCVFSGDSKIILKYEFIIDDNIIDYEVVRDIEKSMFSEILSLNNKIVLNRIGENAYYYLKNGEDFETYSEIDNSTLFLREIYFNTKFREYPVLNKWFDFLRNSIYIDARGKRIGKYTNFKLKIKDYLEENGASRLNEALKSLTGEFEIEYVEKCSGKNVMYYNDEKTIYIRRERIGEPMPLELESEGTSNLLNLMPSFLHVIENNGMLIIDEFSSAFHNFLERILVQFFYNHSKESQLFLVTHATNLLSSEILRPDQVFTFNFKDEDGSKVIKVSEYAKPRTSQNFEKMYLSGMFEGIPHYE